MKDCDFTFKHYEKCMKYAAPWCHDLDIEIIHDLDYEDVNAIAMAMIERNHDIHAKYFIRLHGKYNALSYNNMERYKRIEKLGHELGLHFEPELFEIGQARKEIKFLSDTLGLPIKYVSFHEPSRTGIKIDKIPGMPHIRIYAWSSPYYEGKIYISDSGGRWRDGCMCQHINKHKKLIILTHPCWWYHSKTAENY